jgi:hypothetical protein
MITVLVILWYGDGNEKESGSPKDEKRESIKV